jgi:two-component system cell cycle sensor histidine kinase/response regulator CckA
MPLTASVGVRREPPNVAARVALLYATFGAIWILLSDQVLAVLVNDPHLRTDISIAKGWTYVAVTAMLIYWLVARYLRATEESRHLLERSEQRYRAIVETSLDGVALTDPEGRLAFLNARMAEMLGRRPQDLIGRPLTEFLHGDKGEDLRRQLTAPAPDASGRHDIHLRRADGTEFWGIASTCPMFDDRRSLVGMVTMLTDITDRKQLQDELHQAQKMEAIGQLAGGVAHDFNNLLTAIFGYTDLARHTLTPNHPAVESLKGVVAAAEQAAGVSRSLLTFSRKMPVQKKTTDLNEIVTKAAHLLQRLLPASIRLVTETDKVPTLVNADPTQMQQVIMNLAINARDAMPDGGTLRITTRAVVEPPKGGPGTHEAAAEPRVCLAVSDTGVGMTPEILERIFEPFFTTKPKGAGTGLGLSIIDGIVKEHGGTIRVQSEPGEGTTFTISLPAISKAASAVAGTPAAASRGAGQVILLAEDDAQVRAITVSALTAAGYEVLQAADGEAMLEAFASNRDRVRLILTDAEMPRRGGLDCLRDLRAQGVHVPAILVTGSVDTQVEGQVDEETLLVRKPYAMSKLLALVSQRLSAPPGPPAV